MPHKIAQEMKAGMRRMPSGVSIITAQSADGRKLAMTASSVTSVSDSPASLLVCIHQQAKLFGVMVMGQIFAVNVLGQDHKAVSVLCATSDQGEKRFDLGAWRFDPGHAPYLEDAEAVFECAVDKVESYGTHNIIVGKILSVRVAATNPAPLIYLNGNYAEIKSP